MATMAVVSATTPARKPRCAFSSAVNGSPEKDDTFFHPDTTFVLNVWKRFTSIEEYFTKKVGNGSLKY